MGQLLDICPGCIPFCTISCCNCCVPVPPGLVRAVGKHSGLFKALGLSPQQLTVLWHKFQAFDREASGTLRVSEFLEASGMSESIFATRAFDVLDDDCTGRLGFHEFVRALVVYCTFDKAALSLFAFDVFDFDGDGVLSGPDVQRALLEVYGRGATNIDKLLSKAKAHAHKYSRAKGTAVRGPSHAFALDRHAFDELVRDVPSLCFPVFTVQRRLWEACGGQTFWKQVTKERQMRAKHALTGGRDGAKTYDYHDWRGLISDIGSPTAAQKKAMKEIGIATPTAAGAEGKGTAAAAAADAGSGHAKTPRKSFGFPSTGGSGRRASTGGWGSMLRAMHSEKKYEAGARGAGEDEEPMDITDLERPFEALEQSEVATVAVFGSAAERRAAATAMGEVSERAQKKRERKRRQSAAANLSAIRQITGGSVYEEEHYKRINHVKDAPGSKGSGMLHIASKSEGDVAATGIGDSVARRGSMTGGGLGSARSAASSGGSSSKRRGAEGSGTGGSKVRRGGRRSSLPISGVGSGSRGTKYAGSSLLGISTSASPMDPPSRDKAGGGTATVTGAGGARRVGAARRASLSASPVGSRPNQAAAKPRGRGRRMSQQHVAQPGSSTASAASSRSRRHSTAAPRRQRAPQASSGASSRGRASLRPEKGLEIGF